MSRTPFLALLLVPIALVLGIVLGGHPDRLPGFVRDPLVGDQDTRVVNEAIDEVNSTYYRKIGDKDLSDAAVKGIVASLDDRFSEYFTPKEYDDYEMVTESEFVGIGVVVAQAPRGLRVQTVYKDSPASRGGIKEGDVIVKVGTKPLKGLKVDPARDLIRGPKGTDVMLTVARDGAERTLTVTRATVSTPQVTSRVIDHDGTKTGYVALMQFGEGAHAEVYAALKDVLGKGAKSIVFDLRQDGGGLVTEAQLIASAFIKSGPIVTTRGRSVAPQTLKATGTLVVPEGMPVVVLVDGGTASASEIVTGALQDDKRAKVVGTKTFGKGVFQEVVRLSNGGALKITAGQYFTPKGRNLGGRGVSQGVGITPDVTVADDPKTKPDEALDKALAVLDGGPGAA